MTTFLDNGASFLNYNKLLKLIDLVIWWILKKFWGVDLMWEGFEEFYSV